jgi:catechol 2,3-dioxygenase-like lactoylglutathione lyase family enzyme
VKLQHVALEARHEHVLAEIRFWGLLGFTEALPPAALAKRSVWLSCGPVQVHLLLAQDPLPSPEGHAAFVADDYSATVDRLRGAGVEMNDREAHWGASRCFVRSPAGHRVELMAAPPA